MLLVTVGILALEIVGSIISGSVALLADAGHVFIDGAAVLATLSAAFFVKIARAEKARRAAFWFNVMLLFFVAGFVAYESVERFLAPPEEIVSPLMVAIALLGGAGNYLQHRLLSSAAHEHKHHHRALSKHVISDLFQSGAVVLGGVIIWTTGFVLIDSLLGAGIAVWIFWQAIWLTLHPDGSNCHEKH